MVDIQVMYAIENKFLPKPLLDKYLPSIELGLQLRNIHWFKYAVITWCRVKVDYRDTTKWVPNEY